MYGVYGIVPFLNLNYILLEEHTVKEFQIGRKIPISETFHSSLITIAPTKIWNRNKVYYGRYSISCFNRKMDFYVVLTIENTWNTETTKILVYIFTYWNQF